MVRKRKGKGLALNQSHRKKLKKCSKCENDNNNTSTIAYSDNKAASNESST